MTEEENFTVTPYAVEGAIDYEKLLAEFGADKLTDEQIATFPDPIHPGFASLPGSFPVSLLEVVVGDVRRFRYQAREILLFDSPVIDNGLG